MIFEEIKVDVAYELSPHKHAFINPYIGCSMGCPFCYWLKKEDWEGKIKVKTNIIELLEPVLKEWPHNEFIYLGSICDPFNEVERKYRLSRDCLELIKKYEIPLLITTSASDPVIMEYVEIFKSMKNLIVVVELSRIPFINEMNKGGIHSGIERANMLNREGIKTWATLAPVLPEITHLDRILQELDEEIPVYIDKLDCKADDILGKRTFAWINKDYPELAESYDLIINKNDKSYFSEIEKTFALNKRVKRFPFQLND